jgi:hypothetical protein
MNTFTIDTNNNITAFASLDEARGAVFQLSPGTRQAGRLLASQPDGRNMEQLRRGRPVHDAQPDSRTIVYGSGAISTGELRQVTIDGRRELAPFVLEGASDEIAIAPKSGRLAYALQNLDANIWRLRLDGSPRPPEKLFASVREEMDPGFA